jgi:predicted nucleic acid-binding protein
MPFVVVDTSVSLPATLSPRGLARKFWIILALGALTYEVEHRRLELDALTKEAEESGGTARGLEAALDRIILAEQRRSALLELLPYGIPEDWVAVGSAPLFDEYERKLPEVGQKLKLQLSDADIAKRRRQVEAVCVAGCPPFEPRDAPALTKDPEDDPIVYTALLGGCDLLISDDYSHIVPDRSSELYEHGGASVLAVTFDHLLREHFPSDDVDFDAIEGGWLSAAF